ncbi:hypothetical protein NBRC111894_738 [Sporolactobacillus inulinus]|uniref:Stage III sporulation protein AH n=1 Tax=Sporolactobacillus inulinus TaxID=2078 RepID=A0A4Y1Z859_9BACL|nr:hypothetical protein NBRC111894_738 [Sporolactobacillus inulinus]
MGARIRTGNRRKSTKSALVKLVALALVGMALLAASHLFSEKGSSAPSTAEPAFSTKDSKNLSEIKAGNKTGSMTSIEKYESYVNQNLKNILEQIRGVSDVSVMVTLLLQKRRFIKTIQRYRIIKRVRQIQRAVNARLLSVTKIVK